MTVPGRPILFAAAALALLLLAAVVEPLLIPVAAAADVLMLALCLFEGRWLARQPVSVQRDNWPRIQIDRAAELVYRIENRGRRAVIVKVRQVWPLVFEAKEDSLEVRVAPGEVVRAALEVTPRKRGQIDVGPTEVDVRFPLGLARSRYDLDDATRLSVFPNLEALAAYDILRRTHALRQMGIHRMRLIGAGREFDQLRDYQHDDDYGDINWKATAHHLKPMTKIFQAERSQDVLLCVDCGRMMGDPLGKGTALDRAVDASVMLAHVASRQGDHVGLVLFREAVLRFIKPSHGEAAISRIIQELVDAQPEGVFPSYASLVRTLRTSHKRRSIVFLFTDLNDPQLAADLVKVMPLVSRRHVVVVVSLRDALLEEVASGAAQDRQGLFKVLAARELASERDAHRAALAKAGVQVLEATSDKLSLEAVNRYLAVKMRQML